ncbi:MAG TPA: RNA polymerase sigma factor [Aminivibrio sp.]|nr:RNA polymerase sigma factor [Aminivibrio sp.]
MPEDLELTSRFLEGDESAFEAIVKKYQRMVYFSSLKIVKSHDDADDVVQKTFISVYRNLKSFQGKSSLKTWIFRISVNMSKNLVRDRGRHQGDELTEFSGRLEPEYDDALDKQRQAQTVTQAVDELPPRQREVLSMRVHTGMSFPEIAEVLGCSVSAAKVNYHYAVKALRTRLVPGS